MKAWTQHLLIAFFMTLQGSATVLIQPALQAPQKLDVVALTGGKFICSGTAALFIDQMTMVALVGTSPECYRDIKQVELISFSKDGQVIARKQWPSTFPFVTVPSGRLVVSTSDELLVLNSRLETLQSISLASVAHISVQLNIASPPTVAAYPGFARPPRVFQLFGDPIQMSEILSASDRIATTLGGDEVTWNGAELLRTRGGKTVNAYDISWLRRCSGLCQAWTGVRLQGVVSNQSAAVVLLVAKGSKIPLTDSGGLLPFTRVLAIDLSSGKTLFEQEFLTDQMERSAALDTTGTLIDISDKRHLTFYPLLPQSNQ